MDKSWSWRKKSKITVEGIESSETCERRKLVGTVAKRTTDAVVVVSWLKQVDKESWFTISQIAVPLKVTEIYWSPRPDRELWKSKFRLTKLIRRLRG